MATPLCVQVGCVGQLFVLLHFKGHRYPLNFLLDFLGRAGMAVLLPGILIVPQQSPLLGDALILLCLSPAMLMRSSPRTRLTLKVSLVYGALMGVVIGIINTHLPVWIWLLLAPVFYMLGRWFWKRPLRWIKK